MTSLDTMWCFLTDSISLRSECSVHTIQYLRQKSSTRAYAYILCFFAYICRQNGREYVFHRDNRSSFESIFTDSKEDRLSHVADNFSIVNWKVNEMCDFVIWTICAIWAHYSRIFR